ncbi:hypothetical protein KP2612_000016 [Komagataella phaffii]|uniref:Uncharacterized protein n=1 Tax=Komagataella phaffii (strain GS115 / ATCC 20864) TaxID=644223 RepID=C4QV02_KOMPG|nr:uncharacterized protein PAS_chr1-3_0290 [Komagataella phaffii GS115]AOA60827.1 GQ67_02269T0 [Komagataella phaffii]AOA66308.1 GQ68_02978T0 [Komagataella phaffii GS115]CAH2445726.1 Conserved predicted protein [Komagataella phaffii CBS 7435]CAY67072.1 hypothetical protein PAS_chr1-3_0290 [Komagataella phaffii GS115]
MHGYAPLDDLNFCAYQKCEYQVIGAGCLKISEVFNGSVSYLLGIHSDLLFQKRVETLFVDTELQIRVFIAPKTSDLSGAYEGTMISKEAVNVSIISVNLFDP